MTTYFVDSRGGNDAFDGVTSSTAWQTVERVNRGRYASGDEIRFAANQTFSGTLRLRGPELGSLTVSSFGEGRATIDGGASHGLAAEELHGLTVSTLIFKGVGRKSGNQQGRGVLLERCRRAVIRDVEALGFQRAGIEARKCEELEINRVYAHDNGFAGILVSGSRIRVHHCRAINNPGDPTILNNHSGNGILLSGADDSLVEYCEASGNGWDQPRGGQGNGPVGIWCHDSSGVTIQFCIAHHNKSTSGDGGGFDFDGGTRDSILQYNYSYENHSCGYLVWEYGSQWPIARNTIRYNVSINDREGGVRIGKSGGQDVTQLWVYHNTIISPRDPCITLVGEWRVDRFLPELGMNQVFLWNNLLIGPKGGEIVKGTAEGRFQGNLYWSPDETFGVQGFSSLEAWRQATGQETLENKPVGLFADPKCQDARLLPQLDDPERLTELFAVMLAPGSPAVDRGLDLQALFGIDAGQRDFFGNRAPSGGGPDIGAHEAG
ncbi:MAG TPA: right-handed parallel beta-helix repeat-containing protein [Polyangiaceae bacterium]|jgi:hypothetical protein